MSDIKLEVVVAHYRSHEFELIRPLLPEAKFTVYDKSGIYIGDCRRVKNVGREGFVYLSHIVDNYESLADKTLFLQDDILNHRPGIFQFMVEMVNDRDEFHQYPCTWARNGQIYRRTVVDGFCDLHTLGDPNLIKRSCCELGIKIPQEYTTETCAFFSVTRERIRARNAEFYATLKEWVVRSESNEFALEHMWKIIFGS